MKKILFISAAALLSLASCSKDDDDTASGPSAQAAASLKQGTWRICSYVDNNVDETDGFSSFTFTFSASGIVTASNSLLSATGSWTTGVDDGKHELDLNFTTPALFTEIDEDWEIVSITSTTISLKDVSDTGTETDVLVFTRN